MDLARASKQLTSDVQQQLRFFERNIDNWADVAKVLNKINETIQPYPTGTKILCFTEFMQRIGQCVGRNPELPQGVHMTVIAIYESLIKLLGPDLPQYLDALFIPLLPLYSFATIPTRRSIMQLMKNLLACDIDKRYIGPIVASLLSTQPADADEAVAIKALLDQLETSFGTFYIDSLFKLLSHPCDARRNVLNILYQLLKKYLEQGWDLNPFDNHEEFLLSVLDSQNDDEIRLALDIVILLYPLPNVYGNDMFAMFKRLLTKNLLLLQRDQTIASRVEQWMFSTIPETYSRMLLAALQDLFKNPNTKTSVANSLFTELARREEILDAFLAAFPVLVTEIFPAIPQERLRAFLNQEDFVKIYIYRALVMQLVGGEISIQIKDPEPGIDFLKQTNLVASRTQLDDEKKLAFVKALNGVIGAFPSVKGLHAFATEHKDAVDVFGGAIYSTQESGSSVVGELVTFCVNLYCETYCEDCLCLALQLLEKADGDVVAGVLTGAHSEASDILHGLGCVYERLQEEISRIDRTLTSAPLHRVLVFALQMAPLDLASQTWLIQTLLGVIGLRVSTKHKGKLELEKLLAPQSQLLAAERFKPEEREQCCNTLVRLLQEVSRVQTPLWHLIERHPELGDLTVASLFGEIGESQTGAAETLCKLCCQQKTFYLQKLETLVAQNIYNKETQHRTIQSFILLWQTAAEKFPELRLFKRLTLLLVDMCVRPDVLEQTRLMVIAFVQRVFLIKEWARQLMDICFDQLGGWPELLSDGKRVWLKKKTQTEFQCDVGKVDFVFGLVNALVSAHKEQFALSLIETPAPQPSAPLCFYGESYKPRSQLDRWIDFAMCFVVADDLLPQQLQTRVLSFLQQTLSVLKPLMARVPEVVQIASDVSDRVSAALLTALLASEHNEAAQNVFLAILDTTSHIILLNDKNKTSATVKGTELVQIPELFSNLLRRAFLEPFLKTLQSGKVHTCNFINRALEILATLRVELSQADVNTYVNTWSEDADSIHLEGIQAKYLPAEVVQILAFDEALEELGRKAEYLCGKIKAAARVDWQRALTKNSFLPAKYKFYPASFLAVQTLEFLRNILLNADSVNGDLAYALVQLVDKCTGVITQAQQQSYALVQYSSLALQKEKFALDLADRKKDAELVADAQNSFAIPGVIQTIILLINKAEINKQAVGRKTLEHATNALKLLAQYNPLITALAIIMHVHSDESLGVAECIFGAMNASLFVKAGACLNYFRQKQQDTSGFKMLLSHEALFFQTTAGYAQVSQFLTLAAQITDMDVLVTASARCYFVQEDIKSIFAALIQFHHSKSNTYSANFSALNTADTLIPVESLAGLFPIEVIQKCIQIVHLAVQAGLFAQLTDDDKSVCKRFAARICTTALACFESLKSLNEQAELLTLIHSIIKVLAGDEIPRQPCGLEKQWSEKLKSLGQIELPAVQEKTEEPCSQDLTCLVTVVPYLLQHSLQNRPTRVMVLKMLMEFTRLEVQVQKRIFQHHVTSILKEILRATPEVICSLGPFIGVSTTDLAELTTQLGLKKPEPKQLVETLATLFTPETIQLDQLELAICQQARSPDKNFYATALYLDAVLISQSTEVIKDHWINIVEFITAGKQAQVKDLDVTCYLLGLKCPDKQIFIGFLDQLRVQDPRFWLAKRIAEQWAALQ